MTTVLTYYNMAPYRGGHFKLHTLYLEYSQDLEGIITDQPQLRLFGVHFSLHILDMNLWTKIEQLYQSSSRRRTMPVVFVGCLPYYGPIHMLPSFHRPGEALQACRETAASLNKWCNGFDRNSGYQLSLSLIGISEENVSLLGEMIEAMAACRRDYYPNGMYSCLYIVLHDKYIQVSCWASRHVLAFMILDRSHGIFMNLLNL